MLILRTTIEETEAHPNLMKDKVPIFTQVPPRVPDPNDVDISHLSEHFSLIEDETSEPPDFLSQFCLKICKR